MNQIILFSAPAGTGKTTTVSAIRDLHQYTQFAHLSFASELKKLAYAHLGWNGTKDDTEKGRELLVRLGMEMRINDPDYWVSLVANKCNYLIRQDFDPLICIDDLRFENELAYMRNQFPSLLHIHLQRDDIDIIDNAAEHEQPRLRELADHVVDVTIGNPYKTADDVLKLIN